MTGPLSGRVIVLGVSGGIAAYKACTVVSRLAGLGADVRVVMTENAAKFVSPLTFQTLSGNAVASDMFEKPQRHEITHISWAKAADLFVIAPATANVLAKYAAGIADDLLTTTLLATQARVLAAPAMNAGMWNHPATKQNMATLKARGLQTIGPGFGALACGDIAEGRMAEPEEIVETALSLLCPRRDLDGKRVLVTAGPTREAIDPVRYLSNRSSGKMGYAIAEAARARGAEVTLVTGPVSVAPPAGVTVVPVVSTQDLYRAVTDLCDSHDVIVQAAAPADYTVDAAPNKLKKSGGPPALTLRETPDAAAAVGRRRRPGQFIVAFAAETENIVENARAKLIGKNADLIVANDVTREGAGFSADTNIVTLVTRDAQLPLPLMEKRRVADEILDRCAAGLG
ncbi:MAG: bifunctional phosphopantothenoylcysteine decarboxylase/phosphopantothenate--cysteine ligase CoaBC [Clostridia bacterium]|nr:bifunctional phosphopantothenoylcysteine decarboxylase/phosphopantothenate--cysteine ligase CoaBC [Clostridia bacterium]